MASLNFRRVNLYSRVYDQNYWVCNYSGLFTGGPGILDPPQTLCSDPYFNKKEKILFYIICCIIFFTIVHTDYFWRNCDTVWETCVHVRRNIFVVVQSYTFNLTLIHYYDYYFSNSSYDSKLWFSCRIVGLALSCDFV